MDRIHRKRTTNKADYTTRITKDINKGNYNKREGGPKAVQPQHGGARGENRNKNNLRINN